MASGARDRARTHLSLDLLVHRLRTLVTALFLSPVSDVRERGRLGLAPAYLSPAVLPCASRLVVRRLLAAAALFFRRLSTPSLAAGVDIADAAGAS